MLYKVLNCLVEKCRIVSELSDAVVALIAQQPSNAISSSAGVAVVNHEDRVRVIANATGWIAADGALTSLFGEHAVVVGYRDPVLPPQSACPDLSLSVLHQMLVKYALHIWKEWIFRTARLVTATVTGRYVGVHPTEVEQPATVAAGAETPCAGTEFNFSKGRSFPVPVKALPMGTLNNRTVLASVHKATRIVIGRGESLKQFADLAYGADVVSTPYCWRIRTTEPVSLEPLFGDGFPAEAASYPLWTLHWLIASCGSLASKTSLRSAWDRLHFQISASLSSLSRMSSSARKSIENGFELCCSMQLMISEA